jgi:hypothetical protein
MLYIVNPHHQSMSSLLSQLLHVAFSITGFEEDALTLGSHVAKVLANLPTEGGSHSPTLIIPTFPPTPVSSVTSDSSTGGSSSHTSLTAGVAVGVLVIVALLIGGLWYYLRNRQFVKLEVEPGPLEANQMAYASDNAPAAIQLPYPQQEHMSMIATEGTDWDVNRES